MGERSYYRWVGRAVMALSVLLPLFFSALYLVIALDPDAYVEFTPSETLMVFLGIYTVGIGGFFGGRLLARIPPE